MCNVVSAEIVPFKSISDKIVTKNLLNYCWKKYTSDILSLSGAKVIILCGEKATKTFAHNAFGKDSDALAKLWDSRGGLLYKDKYVVAIPHPSWHSDYWILPEHFFPVDVYKKLKARMAQADII